MPAGKGETARMIHQLPFISVITPVLNEERYIRRFLRSVIEQTYPAGRYEILLADGGSTDGTGEIVRGFQQVEPWSRIRVWVVPGTSRESRLNLCLRQARGAIVARIDAHSVVAPDYLETVAELFGDPPVRNLGVVGGPVRMLSEGFVSRAIGLAMQSRFGVGHVEFRRPDFAGRVPTVQNASYARRVFEEVGEFDEGIGCEDSDFHYRVRRAGYELFVTPRLRFGYFPRRRLGSLARQFANYGRWRLRFFCKHRRVPSPLYLLPLLFAAAVAVAPLVGVAAAGLRGALGLGAGVYAAIALAFALKTGGRRGLYLAPLVVLVYPLMHAAYGAGMWSEILRLGLGRRLYPARADSSIRNAPAQAEARVARPAGEWENVR